MGHIGVASALLVQLYRAMREPLDVERETAVPRFLYRRVDDGFIYVSPINLYYYAARRQTEAGCLRATGRGARTRERARFLPQGVVIPNPWVSLP